MNLTLINSLSILNKYLLVAKSFRNLKFFVTCCKDVVKGLPKILTKCVTLYVQKAERASFYRYPSFFGPTAGFEPTTPSYQDGGFTSSAYVGETNKLSPTVWKAVGLFCF